MSRDTRRNVVQARLTDSGLAWIDELAEIFQMTRSDVVRHSLGYAAQHQGAFRSLLQTKAEEM